jgi:hypothetical protein
MAVGHDRHPPAGFVIGVGDRPHRSGLAELATERVVGEGGGGTQACPGLMRKSRRRAPALSIGCIS